VTLPILRRDITKDLSCK